MSFLKNSINLNIVLENQNEEEITIRTIGKTLKMPLYKVEETVQGRLKINAKSNKNLQHKGIDIQIEGFIESLNEKLRFSFAKQTVQLQKEGTISDDLNLPFDLREFARLIETCENSFGRARYILKAIVHRNFFPQIVVEKEIAVQLNYFRPSVPRLYRLMITCHGEPSLTYQQDKREYFATEPIIGKIDIEPEAPKLKTLGIQLIRKDEFRMLPGFFMANLEEELIDFIDLNTELKKAQDSEVKSIPVKISLSKYNLPPSARYQGPKLFFAISYLLKIKFEEEGGRKWSKEVKVPIRRDR